MKVHSIQQVLGGDDYKVRQVKSSLIQGNEYYPFGMQTSNSWTRDGVTGNSYLANGGTELNATSNLYDLQFRNYDPVLGRMNQVDPAVDIYSSLTPYNYSCNNPVAFNDPLGDSPVRREGDNLIIDLDLVEEMGGSWFNTGGDGTWTTFTSQAQALAFGIAYNNYHDTWANTLYNNEFATMFAFAATSLPNPSNIFSKVTLKLLPAPTIRNSGPTRLNWLKAISVWTQFYKFDISKAVNAIHDNAYKDSKGHRACGTYVRFAIETGLGVAKDELKGKMGEFAKDFGPRLVLLGFTPITTSSYLPGDIIVIQPVKGHPSGHTQMFNGSIWISDYYQNSAPDLDPTGFWPGGDYRNAEPPPSYQVYRWQPNWPDQ